MREKETSEMENWKEIWDQYAESNIREKMIGRMECIWQAPTEEMFYEYLQMIEQCELTWCEKYHLYWQILGKIFTFPEKLSERTELQLFQTYCKISGEFQALFELGDFLKNREENIVLLTTQQFLDMGHAPTKTVLDRAYVLAKEGKKVIIINTAEEYGGEFAGLKHSRQATYDEELSEIEMVAYQNVSFPFMQFDSNMPQTEETKMFLEYVRKLRPAYIINIGGNSLLSDCCARILPVLNINTVPSGVAQTLATCQTIGRPLCQRDLKKLAVLGKEGEDVIVGRFTASLRQQSKWFLKSDLNLPEEGFVMIVVGARLTEEVTQEFLDALKPALQSGAHLVLAGRMNQYEEWREKDSILREHSTYLGFCTDMLAVLDCCDLYVNPRRTGGGTSVVEAMYKGLPVISVGEGDVAVAAGENFCVKDYREMTEKLLRYMEDEGYYMEMSAGARERAAYMLDSTAAFGEILQEFERKIEKI